MKDRHDIHLCQPDSSKSCGACCGLYNYRDSSRESLVRRLRSRTALFHDILNESGDAPAFSEEVKHREEGEKIYDVIYCCEFLGFLDKAEKRVGCLLHPCQNGGRDLRGASFYGRELCDGHRCPSYHYLTQEEQRTLVTAIDDWYLYGLCITDIDLVKEYFRLLCEAIADSMDSERFCDGTLQETIRRFFSLKISWPFRAPGTNRFGKYWFDGSQYMIAHIDYEGLGCERSRFDRIFLSLTSHFDTRDDIREAEEIIEKNIDEFVGRYRKKY